MRDVKCSCFIYSNMFQYQFYKETMKEVLLLCFIIRSCFFVPSRLYYKQLLKNTCQPYQIWYRRLTSLQLALNLSYKRKRDKTHLPKRISLHPEKDQTKKFSPFLYKRPSDHREEFLKSRQFHFK